MKYKSRCCLFGLLLLFTSTSLYSQQNTISCSEASYSNSGKAGLGSNNIVEVATSHLFNDKKTFNPERKAVQNTDRVRSVPITDMRELQAICQFGARPDY